MRENKSSNNPIVLISRDIAFTFPLSFAYLAGFLKSKNEEIKIYFRGKYDDKTLVEKVLAENPCIIGFGGLYPELKEIKELIKKIKSKSPQLPIVIGGQMVSPTPEFSLGITGADYGVIGEGEITFYNLICAIREQQDLSTIKGIVYKKDSIIINTGAGEYISNIDHLPKIPYELFPLQEWLQIGRWYVRNFPQPHWRINDRVINVHGGRGCPFRCNFCYHHSKPRYRSIDIMLTEAQVSVNKYHANMLYFSDDLVLASPNRAEELTTKLKALNLQIEYSISTRFDILDKLSDSLLQNLKQTGCRIMGLGVESGSDKMLKIIGKNCTASIILKNIKRLTDVGILPTVSIQIGQEDETSEDVEQSINLMKETIKINPNIQYAFTITTPFPGSPLYNYLKKSGKILSDLDFYNKYFSSTRRTGDWKQVVNLSKMSNDQVLFYFKKIHRIYKYEKLKALGIKVFIVELIHKIFIRFNNFVGIFILKFLPNTPLTSLIRDKFDKFMDYIFKQLEYWNLKFRKIKN